VRPLRLRLRGDCGHAPDTSGACRAGMVPASKTGAGTMPLSIAQNRAWNLALTLKVCIIVFRISDQIFGVIESSEFEGDADSVVREYDPFAR
jgi:hypothetical protein